MSRAKIKQSRQIVELKNRVLRLEESVDALGAIVKSLVMMATGGDPKTKHAIINGEIISLDTVSLNPPPGDDSE